MSSTDYFERKLDEKRRLTIPVDLRAEFQSGYVITQGFGKYLHLYPKQVWDEVVEPSLKGNILDQNIADLNVKFRTGKFEGSIDQKQGRLSIDKSLLDFAGIKNDVISVRAGLYWRISAKVEH